MSVTLALSRLWKHQISDHTVKGDRIGVLPCRDQEELPFMFFNSPLSHKSYWKFVVLGNFPTYPTAIKVNWTKQTTFLLFSAKWKKLWKVSCGWNPVWDVNSIFKFICIHMEMASATTGSFCLTPEFGQTDILRALFQPAWNKVYLTFDLRLPKRGLLSKYMSFQSGSVPCC